MLNDPDLDWCEIGNGGEHKFRPAQERNADLSESALPYATKEIEVEEVDFSVEINGLMGVKSISEVLEPSMGGEIGPDLLSATYGTHWKTRAGGGRVEVETGEREGGTGYAVGVWE